jgi:hypothetical protein
LVPRVPHHSVAVNIDHGQLFGRRLEKSYWLLELARTYLEVQARLWPDLAETAAVPAADPATIAAMADDFERRYRHLQADVFRPGDTPIAWIALAVAYLRFSDENSNPQSLDQQLLNVLNRARRDGVFVPWQYVLADAAVSGTLACRTGYTLAKTIVEWRDEFGETSSARRVRRDEFGVTSSA